MEVSELMLSGLEFPLAGESTYLVPTPDSGDHCVWVCQVKGLGSWYCEWPARHTAGDAINARRTCWCWPGDRSRRNTGHIHIVAAPVQYVRKPAPILL